MSKLVILNFHGIGEPGARIDADERRFWVSRDQFFEILDMVDGAPADREIVFTFDDGNKSDIEIAAPALAKAGKNGSFYVLAGRFEDPDYLSREDCASLAAMGMEVGLHGRRHVDWRALDDATLQDEVVVAREEVARASGRPVRSVGIPLGRYDRRVLRLLRSEGFEKIRTSDGGPTRSDAQIQSRTSMRCDMPLDQVRALVTGTETLKRRARRTAGNLYRRYLRQA